MNAAALPGELLPLALLIALLGARHGVDADHLAAVDALTRHNAAARPSLARRVGLLFSLGHGVVVVTVALVVAGAAGAWQVPHWLESFGGWTSVGLLIALACLNLASVLRTPADRPARLVGWRSGVFARLLRAGNARQVMGIGALFALSFDTFSQATLFAIVASRYGGWQPTLLVALLFVLGMLLADGVNGWWIARLVRRSDRHSRIASRVMALAVAGIALLTAGLGIAALTLPRVDAWIGEHALWFGAAIIALSFASYRIGLRLGRATARLAAQPTSATPGTNR